MDVFLRIWSNIVLDTGFNVKKMMIEDTRMTATFCLRVVWQKGNFVIQSLKVSFPTKMFLICANVEPMSSKLGNVESSFRTSEWQMEWEKYKKSQRILWVVIDIQTSSYPQKHETTIRQHLNLDMFFGSLNAIWDSLQIITWVLSRSSKCRLGHVSTKSRLAKAFHSKNLDAMNLHYVSSWWSTSITRIMFAKWVGTMNASPIPPCFQSFRQSFHQDSFQESHSQQDSKRSSYVFWKYQISIPLWFMVWPDHGHECKNMTCHESQTYHVKDGSFLIPSQKIKSHVCHKDKKGRKCRLLSIHLFPWVILNDSGIPRHHAYSPHKYDRRFRSLGFETS